MRGQLVVVKDVNGDALVRRMWDFSSRCVYIMSEDQWELRISGGKSMEAVGFPIKDVFVYNEVAIDQIESDNVHWDTLTPFPRDANIAA